MVKRKYGYLRDPKDSRDWIFKAVHAPKEIHLPEKVSLRDKFKEPPYDQGELGSCSAQAATAAFTFVHGGGPYSRLALYYCERMLEGTVDQDSGAFLRDAIKVLSNTGVGLEKDWPYDISKFNVEPPPVEVQEAAENKIATYSSLTDGNADEYRQCLADGYPFIIGIQLYRSFESQEVASNGIVFMPENNEEHLGGHAVTVIGYDENFKNGFFSPKKRYYEVRNSWGTNWGDDGHFWIPAEYLENPSLATDAWTIRK
jgi:C1A family cysteine protease